MVRTCRPGFGGLLETGRDVTEQRRAEAELRKSEHRYRNMFQAMAASFWELDFFPVGAMLRKLREGGVTDFAGYFRDNPAFVREMMRATRIIDVNEQTVALFGNGSRDALMTSLDLFWPEESNDIYRQASSPQSPARRDMPPRRSSARSTAGVSTPCSPRAFPWTR